ncbi:ABC transporter ATP-binding protein [Nakamurella leprariae]|uniref:ATP-binding cassette domain-containing protein n=1 Tax=Nakamurella leprariae TaxID=2803911 RepID=A0A939C3I8_9ACTN|nr:ATP-binding cassette domain-containing protein [Nakamurella leprariae]MBM9469464.1 ATP-binding cassette domain-containing protein [Nakamurella leprariae]
MSEPQSTAGTHGPRPAYVELVLDAATKQYGSARSRFTAVDAVTATFTSDQTVGVVGESGSGKSTLAKMLVGFETPNGGRVTFNGESVAQVVKSRSGRMDFRRAVQFIGQDTTSSFDPRRRLDDSVLLPLRTLLGLSDGEARARMAETLDALRLPVALASRYPFEVSGGQRQRFAIARGLVVRPRILVCDEVVSALDVSVQGAILNLIKDYCEQHSAGLIFVSHGLPATGFVAQELLVMYHGRMVERGPSAQVFADPQHAYTRSLLNAYRGEPTLEPVGDDDLDPALTVAS